MENRSYLKKIESINRLNGILTGIIIGCIVGILLMAAVLWMGDNSSFLTLSLVIWGSVMVTSILVNLFIASSRSRGVRRRIASLETTVSQPFEKTSFRRVSDEVLLGGDWLVCHNGYDYRFWTREIVSRIEVRQQKQSSDKGILEIHVKGYQVVEEVPVTSAEKVRNVLNAWLSGTFTA